MVVQGEEEEPLGRTKVTDGDGKGTKVHCQLTIGIKIISPRLSQKKKKKERCNVDELERGTGDVTVQVTMIDADSNMTVIQSPFTHNNNDNKKKRQQREQQEEIKTKPTPTHLSIGHLIVTHHVVDAIVLCGGCCGCGCGCVSFIQQRRRCCSDNTDSGPEVDIWCCCGRWCSCRWWAVVDLANVLPKNVAVLQ